MESYRMSILSMRRKNIERENAGAGERDRALDG